MATAIPVIPAMPAGYIVQAADLNNLAYGAQFVLTKPMTRVHDGTGGQSLAVLGTAVQYSIADFDNDGMWNAGSPTRLTVQTPGFYKIDYLVDTNSGLTLNTVAQATTGVNNPAGAGVSTQCWPGYGVGQGRTCGRSSGIIPYFLYALDYVQVFAYPGAAGATTASSAAFTPSYLVLELVSI